MDPLETLRMATDTIKAHKLRSILTTLGVLIGVGAVLSNVAMLTGFDAYVEEMISGMGANFVMVIAGDPFQSQVPGAPEQYFDEHLYEALRGIPHLKNSTASRDTIGTIRYMNEEETVGVTGAKPGYFEARETEIIEGAPLSRQDKYSIVISEDLAKYTFSRPIIPRSTIELTLMTVDQQVTEEFKVKGIQEEVGGMVSEMLTPVYIPLSTMNDMLNREGITHIGVYAESPDAVNAVSIEAINILDRQLKVEPRRAKRVEEGGAEEGGIFEEKTQKFEEMFMRREEYTIVTQEDILSFARDISSGLKLVLIGVASISLLIGGIGIANIMLVTVAERTREIGVMKAVGAKSMDVLAIFLFEAGFIGLLGGAFGLAIAFLASYTIVPYMIGVMGIITLPWVVLAFGISFGVGVLSGLYPAVRAARMDPVVALSYE